MVPFVLTLCFATPSGFACRQVASPPVQVEMPPNDAACPLAAGLVLQQIERSLPPDVRRALRWANVQCGDDPQPKPVW